MRNDENPIEPFKRATTATMRAIAENDELEVTFGKGNPFLRGNAAHLPLPNVGCTPAELDAVRGVGDEFALRRRYHDDAVHRAHAPNAGPAQELFQWVEDARIASIGTLRMEGVARNLDASLEALCRQAAFDTVTAEPRRRSASRGLLVRQRLTGRALPPSAENVVRFWRDYVEERAGEHIDELRDCMRDQATFARRCRSILADLGLAAEFDDPPMDDSDQDAESLEDGQDPESELSPEDVVLDEDSLGEEDADGETTVVEMDADMTCRSSPPSPRTTRPRTPPRTTRDASDVDFNYQAFTTEFDEVVKAEDCAIRRSYRGSEDCLTSSSSRSSTRPRSSPTACSAASREADPRLGVRPRRGHPRHVAALPGGCRSDEPARLQAGEGDELPRHRRHDADRQLRIHARAFHHHRRRVRRHPWPHAGTLLRAGRDLGVHHPRLAGRPIPGKSGSTPANPRVRAA